MTLTAKEKARNKREGMIGVARRYSTGTYIRRFVSPVFQRMIRAEAAAQPEGYADAVIAGEFSSAYRFVGACVCVTCGKLGPWSSGLGGMHTGHFLASRRNSILFEESNVAPQCSRCNRYESGAPQRFRLWMESVRGPREIERLERLKQITRSFTREELVDMRIAFAARLKAAKERMAQE